MAQTLKSALLDADRRPAVVNDLAALVDSEVANKSGASGMALKGGYGLLKKISPHFVPHAIDGMLDELVDRMEPVYTDFTASSEASLSTYLKAQGADTADALLGVTDARAAASSRESVKKIYSKLRPQAKKHVEAAMPALGDVIARHTA